MRITRTVTGLVAVSAVALALVPPAPAPAAPVPAATVTTTEQAPRTTQKPKIARAVLERYAKADRSDVWVRLAARRDVAPLKKIKNRRARGQEVVDELKATARGSQGAVKALLDAEGLKYETFWATNAIYVRSAPEAVVRSITRMAEVEEIRAPRTYVLPKPAATRPSSVTPQSVEWGLSNIKADQVWAQNGRRGQGIVVANVDTGVQYDHPALVRQYRGDNGDGTFSHGYNWYDPTGTCTDPGPCDGAGHGTHTMGTMAGDDGQGNQIGVAPGAKWIAAKGCATENCSDVDLLLASQWMLAPTDASGNDPDVSKRPDIVNNSWGSQPSNDPLMEDVQLAWAASGIMGVWANGNEGPKCQTSGAPGSRIINYSVGAYDGENRIATFSSRGPGQDGEIKPNISAPGVNIRSSVPGSGYAVLSGTSMATPHVAGAIALLWSARPEYAHDIAGTRSLLDLTAIDTADAQCGGTAADNPVYGEGRLDALALVTAGEKGTSGLTGTVTDAATGQVVPGAEVGITGPLNRTLTVGTDGKYSATLLAGDYQVTAKAFGYQTRPQAVTITKDTDLTLDIALVPTERVNLTGTVTDGSGVGRGLAAKITAGDGDGHAWSTTTDPATGAYTLPLLPSSSYTLTYTSTETGYDPATRQLTLGETGQTLDVELIVNLACTADGYQVTRDGPTQPFEGTRRPKGWTVTNVDPGIPGLSYKPGWESTDAGRRGNHTGGDGGFAIVDSLNSGKGHIQDTYLTSPSFNLTGRANATIEFVEDLQAAVNQTTSVDLSVDGGRTWQTVWTAKGFPGAPGPATRVIPIPQAADKTNVTYRLHYEGQRSGWWAVDNAFIGDRTCTAVNP